MPPRLQRQMDEDEAAARAAAEPERLARAERLHEDYLARRRAKRRIAREWAALAGQSYPIT